MELCFNIAYVSFTLHDVFGHLWFHEMKPENRSFFCGRMITGLIKFKGVQQLLTVKENQQYFVFLYRKETILSFSLLFPPFGCDFLPFQEFNLA